MDRKGAGAICKGGYCPPAFVRTERRAVPALRGEKVRVPAGSFDAVRVNRTDQNRAFNAWYVPAKYPVPVKISQKDGGNLTLELVSYSQP